MSSLTPRLLVAESSTPVAATLKTYFGARYQVSFATTTAEAVAYLEQRTFEAAFVSNHGRVDAAEVCERARLLPQGARVALVLGVPPDDARAVSRLERFDADALVVAPFKKQTVLGALVSAMRVRELSLRHAAVTAELEYARRGVKLKAKRPGFNAVDEAFFRRYILLEVKRSRRYRYAVAMLIVACSPSDQEPLQRAQALLAISGLLRDVDVAMPFAKDRFVVFLPHTSKEGALTVAERIVERLSREPSTISASVGVAMYEPAEDAQDKAVLSFGGMVRSALGALKEAQSEGRGVVLASR